MLKYAVKVALNPRVVGSSPTGPTKGPSQSHISVRVLARPNGHDITMTRVRLAALLRSRALPVAFCFERVLDTGPCRPPQIRDPRTSMARTPQHLLWQCHSPHTRPRSPNGSNDGGRPSRQQRGLHRGTQIATTSWSCPRFSLARDVTLPGEQSSRTLRPNGPPLRPSISPALCGSTSAGRDYAVDPAMEINVITGTASQSVTTGTASPTGSRRR
jgi:hypothetical protein